MEQTEKSFGAYLEQLGEAERNIITQLDSILSDKFGEANRSVWEGVFWGGSEQQIVGYGAYEWQTTGKPKTSWFMVGLAVQKNYCSLYFNATEDKQYLTKKYAAQLGKVKIGSSSVSFSKLENLNLDTVTKLVDISYGQWVELQK